MAFTQAPASAVPMASPLDVIEWFKGVEVPDPITFVLGPQWLARPNLYPRQATLLKVIFLRDDLFTPYDREVIAEWMENYQNSKSEGDEIGDNGTPPDLYERIAWLKSRGYKWFKEVMLALGRRAGKGYVSALAMAYVLWNYMGKGDPQDFYGIDRDKELVALIFAGKRDQAIANLWGDLYNVITTAPCFAKYISRAQGQSLSVFAPHDFVRISDMEARGIRSTRDPATFQILPKESTALAGRGPASFCLDPETPVLTAELEWLPIKKLAVGDRVVGFDEYPERKGAQRKMREAEIVRTWRTRKAALRLVFEDGTDVVCSRDHRWLFKDFGKGGGYLWREAAKLTVGSRIRHLVDPWEEDQSREAGYLAGFYDGEGCVSGWNKRAGRDVFFSQNEGVVLDAVLNLLRAKGFEPIHYTNTTKSCQQWALGGINASMAFLGSIRPMRLMPKQKGIWEGVAPRGGLTPSGLQRKDAFKTIAKIEELPEQELVDVQTTTHTFIANGLFSHNCQGFDEMAHVVKATAKADAKDVYSSASPSLDQFGKDGFLVAPSSTWEMIGQFYELCEQAQANENGQPLYPTKLLLQLESWEIYYDWERAGYLPALPEGFTGDLGEYAGAEGPPLYFQSLRGAIQTYDEEMQQIEAANPDTFAVERRSKWASVLDAYLDASKVDQIFQPWMDRPEAYGPAHLTMQRQGLLVATYKAHGDPAEVNCRFGFAVAHEELDRDGVAHCVFDLIHYWDPAEFPEHTIDYDEVMDWIWDNVVLKFHPEELTFDQFNNIATIQRLQKKVRAAHLPKRVNVFEKTATNALNWTRFETFKAAINMGLVHAPPHEEAKKELTFLQRGNGNKVDHPTAGPVQTKDIADCLVESVHTILGEQMNNFLNKDLRNFRPGGGLPGGIDPLQRMSSDDDPTITALANFGRRSSRRRMAG